MDIAELREQINKKHRAALVALDTIAEYLAELPSVAPSAEATAAIGKAKRPTGGRATRVDQVLGALSDEYQTVDRVKEITGLEDVAVRAVLYSKFVRPKVQSKKMGNRMAFRLKQSGQQSSNGGGVSASALVRELLAKHPEGLTSSAIIAAVGDDVTKITGSTAAIGAALYNAKKRGKMRHNESTGVYTLARS